MFHQISQTSNKNFEKKRKEPINEDTCFSQFTHDERKIVAFMHRLAARVPLLSLIKL